MNSPRATVATILLFCVGLTLPSATVAQEADQPEEAEQRAKEYFDKGARHFYEGDYSGAILEFRRAHELSPDALFLYNIAVAHVRLGNLEKAREVAMEATAMGLDPGYSAKNAGRLVAIDTAMVSRSLANETPDLSSETPAPATDANVSRGPVVGVDDSAVAEPQPGASVSHGWFGLGVAGLGAGLLSGALVLRAGAARSDTTAALGLTDAERDEVATWDDDLRTARRVLFLSGLGAAVAGVGWLLADWLVLEGGRAPVGPLGVTGLALIGSGAGALLSGMVADRSLARPLRSSDEAGLAGNETFYDVARGEVDWRQNAGRGLVVVGGVLVAAGSVLVVVDRPSSRERAASRWRIAPALSGAGLSASVDF